MIGLFLSVRLPDRGERRVASVEWRRALRAGEYDPVGLLPVTVEAPVPQFERPAPTATPTPVIGAASMGAIEINVGNTRVRIEGSPNEATVIFRHIGATGLPA